MYEARIGLVDGSGGFRNVTRCPGIHETSIEGTYLVAGMIALLSRV